MTWSFVFVSAEAQAELEALPLDIRASFERIVRRVIILRVFTKKTQKTPRREVELARRSAKEVT